MYAFCGSLGQKRAIPKPIAHFVFDPMKRFPGSSTSEPSCQEDSQARRANPRIAVGAILFLGVKVRMILFP